MREVRLALLLTALWAGATGAQTFSDVPTDYWAYTFIERFAARGITSGCGNGRYCPQDSVTRAQMAVFLERGINGGGFVPPAATGDVFDDVAAGDFAASFIERLFADGITAGCGNNRYCPASQVTRAQMAVFLLRARHGSDYSPPPATGAFADVNLNHWAIHWIEQLAAEGITAGCGNGNYCPEDPVTRAQMAVFIVRALLEPPVLTSIQLSDNALVLDRWEDTATISATAVDQDGFEVPGASISWLSSDANVAAVDNSGNVSTWLGGDVTLTVEASKDGTTVNNTVDVTVAIQRNSSCTVPTEFPVQGPVNPPSRWDIRKLETQFFIPGAEGIEVQRQITLDIDRDGDPDLLSAISTLTMQGVEVPISADQRVWLNDGSGHFSDGTEAILGQNTIPWDQPRNMNYADFDGDGFQDVVVFQQGWERDPIGCGPPGSCLGGPNLLMLPQPGEFSDSAPSRLDPYDVDEFTHSGAIGDIDCDGDVDIFEAQWGGSRHRLQINSGAGFFESDDSRLPQDLLSDSISASTLCDLDRDGDPDLVISAPGPSDTGRTRLLVNDGFGRFRSLAQGDLPVGDLVSEAACGDLDLNGYNDIVLNVPSTTVYLNAGELSLEGVTEGELPPDLTSNGLAIIDLNGDGWPDVTPEGSQSVYWNVGDGTFTPTAMPGVCCNNFTTTADFDTDGYPDVFMFNSHRDTEPNTLYLNRPGPAPAMRVFATSSRYTANLGGLAGADAICQAHADAAGLPGTYAAYLSDSTTHAINRIPHAEYRRVGDSALVVPDKVDLSLDQLVFAVANDEFGNTILADTEVMTGTDHGGVFRSEPGIGSCSDWTRDTDESPGLVASGHVDSNGHWWVQETVRNCSASQRLYCFQTSGEESPVPSCDLPAGEEWAPEARDCGTEDCSDGRWKSWDGRHWCRALITQEFDPWNVTVPAGRTVFEFWADWGAWDLNSCGDGQASIAIDVCGLNHDLTRDGEEQKLSCDVSGQSSITIEKPNAGVCDYVIIGDPVFR